MTTNPLHTQATQLEAELQRLIHETTDEATLAIYAEALANLERCMAALARLPELEYYMLKEGDVIQFGDEQRVAGSAWYKCGATVGATIRQIHIDCGYEIRRPIPPGQQPVSEPAQEGKV